MGGHHQPENGADSRAALEADGSIVLTPNYENTAAFLAEQIILGNVDKGSERKVMHSLLEQVRYLAQTDIEACNRMVARVGREWT